MPKRARSKLSQTYLKVWVTRELKTRVTELANADGRKVSPYLRRLIVAHIRDTSKKGT